MALARGRRIPVAALALLATLAAAETARAQVPAPRVPYTPQRSGLFTRHVPVVTNLPVDRDRDVWDFTRWNDRHHERTRPNSWKDGGLYGYPLPADCTDSQYPFFRGSPGTKGGPQCEPPSKYGRLFHNFVHPWRPVGYYYAGGSTVPIYDLDPVVPGPGPFPWGHFFKRPTGG